MSTNSEMSAEPDFAQVIEALREWASRRRLVHALVWVPRGLLAGLIMAAIVATLARIRPLLSNEQMAIAAVALALVGLLSSLLPVMLRGDTLEQQARNADRLLQLQERLSTAVQIHEGRIATTSSLARLQLGDTLSALRGTDARSSMPLRLIRRDWLLILLAIALLSVAVVLPNPQSQALKRRQSIARSIEEQIDALEVLEEEIARNPELSEVDKELLLEPIENALVGLSDAELSQEGAVATLSEAEAELRALADEFSAGDLREALRDAGRPLAEDSTGRSFGESLQAGELPQAAAAAAGLADAVPGLAAEEREALAEALAEAASTLQATDEQLSQQLAEAAQSLRQGDTNAAQQALREASGTLQQRAQRSAAAAQAGSAASRVGQGRQEVAQAGATGQGDQQGQGQGQGEGQGEGQGAGQGQNPGEGQGQGSSPGQGAQTEQGEGTGGPGPGGGHDENVFVPDFADLNGEPGVDIELPAQCLENPADCGGLLGETPTEFRQQGSSIPYSEVFGDYRDAAYEALAEDYIPLGLRDYVREYFSSLEP